MAIIRKHHLDFHLEELDQYYRELRELVQGTEPSANMAHAYNCEPDQFRDDFRDVNLGRVLHAVEFFKVSVQGLKMLKSKVSKPNHRS